VFAAYPSKCLSPDTRVTSTGCGREHLQKILASAVATYGGSDVGFTPLAQTLLRRVEEAGRPIALGEAFAGMDAKDEAPAYLAAGWLLKFGLIAQDAAGPIADR
jgi:hypothetical protein